MVSTARPCAATTKRGEPCRSYAVGGSDFCFAHAPELAQERKEARARGGRARHNRKLDGPHDAVEIYDLSDVVRVLVEEINTVRSLEVSLGRGRVVGYLCSTLAGIYTQSEIEQRIAALEHVLKER